MSLKLVALNGMNCLICLIPIWQEDGQYFFYSSRTWKTGVLQRALVLPIGSNPQ